jgi:selenide,water dikinase
VGDQLVLGKPLGVGVYSSALKKQQLDAQGYRDMVSVTTQLNKPGSVLSDMDAVHAITDVTGFGLAGHALEIARGSGLDVGIHWGRVPFLPQAQALAQAGCITGASGRNQQSYFDQVVLPTSGWDAVQSALLSDPQTSGGLLVSCAPAAVDEVLAVFHAQGFAQAAVVGQVQPCQEASPRLRIQA